MQKIHGIMIGLCLLASFELHAQVYKWVDESGRTHFSDKPPVNHVKKQAATKPAAPAPQAGGSSPNTAKPPAQTRYSRPVSSKTLQIRRALEQEDFEQLNRLLSDRLQAVRTDILKESELQEAYQAFEQDNPAWRALFERWIAKYPEQYPGYLARATYLIHRGWEARGGAYINKTPKENIVRMTELIDLAQSDLIRVLNQQPDSLWAYCLQINIAKSRGDYPGAARILTRATNRYPATYLARKFYIETLDPKWGGSMIAMTGFAESAQRHADINPSLRRLVAYAYYEAGRMAYINKKYEKARKLLTMAIGEGGRPRSYFMRGKSYARLDEHEKALADFNRAISQQREDGDYYYWRAKSFAALKRYDETLIDIDRAHALKPDDKWISKFRLALISLAQTPNIASKDDGQHPEGSSEALFERARKLIENGKLMQAKGLLDQAIEMSPDEFRYYQMVDLALFKMGKMREILGYWESYIALNPKDDRAYLERSGTYYHLQDFKAAKIDARQAMKLGNVEAGKWYKRLQQLTKN